MKRCCTCHLWKKFEDFHLRAGSRDGRQARCRSCTRNWYEANKQEHKARTKLRSDGVRVTNRALMKDYLLRHPCVECGETDLRVLDFDHRPGEKKTDDIGRLMAGGYSWKAILLEMAKCDVRCANCHRIVTCERANNWRQKAVVVNLKKAEEWCLGIVGRVRLERTTRGLKVRCSAN